MIIILEVQTKGALLNRTFFKAALKMLFAAFIASCVCYSMVKFFPLRLADNSFFAVFPKFCLITATSFLAYLIASYFLNLDEIRPVVDRVKKVLFKNMK